MIFDYNPVTQRILDLLVMCALVVVVPHYAYMLKNSYKVRFKPLEQLVIGIGCIVVLVGCGLFVTSAFWPSLFGTKLALIGIGIVRLPKFWTHVSGYSFLSRNKHEPPEHLRGR